MASRWLDVECRLTHSLYMTPTTACMACGAFAVLLHGGVACVARAGGACQPDEGEDASQYFDAQAWHRAHYGATPQEQAQAVRDAMNDVRTALYSRLCPPQYTGSPHVLPLPAVTSPPRGTLLPRDGSPPQTQAGSWRLNYARRQRARAAGTTYRQTFAEVR